MRNWSGHVTFGATAHVSPSSVAELQSVVASAPRVRALGTGHSFNDIADTDGIHVDVSGLPQDVEIDAENQIAWLPAGMRFGTAARILDAAGWAVHNLASLGHISVAGTVATGTHGSGDDNPTLAANVVALERVSANGDLEIIDGRTDGNALNAAVVALGALGVVTRVAVRIEPTFTVRQYVIDDVSHQRVEEQFTDVFGAAYSVSFFTTWSPQRTGQIWMKRRDTGDWRELNGDHWMGGVLADGPRHPLPGHDPINCTEQLGAPGPWHERLPHFRLDFTPSSGDELQTEYLVPRDRAVAALSQLWDLAPRIHPLLHVSEIRTMAADELWLSGANGRPTVGIHFTWHRTPDVLPLLPELDALLAPLGGRPHWGKLFAPVTPLGPRYPRFDDFIAAVGRADPTGKFRNRFVDEVLASR